MECYYLGVIVDLDYGRSEEGVSNNAIEGTPSHHIILQDQNVLIRKFFFPETDSFCVCPDSEGFDSFSSSTDSHSLAVFQVELISRIAVKEEHSFRRHPRIQDHSEFPRFIDADRQNRFIPDQLEWDGTYFVGLDAPVADRRCFSCEMEIRFDRKIFRVDGGRYLIDGNGGKNDHRY